MHGHQFTPEKTVRPFRIHGVKQVGLADGHNMQNYLQVKRIALSAG
jgi:hypothetical protein